MTEACAACPARLIDDVAKVLGASLSDVVPAEAQVHLQNAQRELLLALAVTIEHHARRAHPAATGPKKRSGGTPRSRRPARVELE